MTEIKTNVRSTLNDLIQTCKDGEEGFRSAAENIGEPELQAALQKYSQQRAKFAAELKDLAMEEGDQDPADSGSVAGTLHRGWINLKTAVTGKNRHAILAECESGEDIAKKAYREASQMELPERVHFVVSRQFSEIRAAHDWVKAERDSSES